MLNPKRQIFYSSKLREFADDNFKFDETGGKFLKRVENTEGKGEIAHYEQFLLFPQYFKQLLLQICENQGLFGKGLNAGNYYFFLSQKSFQKALS